MKVTTLPEIHEQMTRVSKCMTTKQRQANGRKAWQTRIANLEKKAQ